jgi:DNA-binding MarR family transcriptional regulator
VTFPTHPSLEGYTGFLMRKISAATFAHFSEITGEYGLHPMHFGMLTVLDAESPISQHDLSRRTGVDPSSMVARMDVLEERGLVERQRRADDRRAYEIRLTDKGRSVLEELRSVAARHMEQMLAPLGPAERKQLNELLRRISAGLDEAGVGADPG